MLPKLRASLIIVSQSTICEPPNLQRPVVSSSVDVIGFVSFYNCRSRKLQKPETECPFLLWLLV